MILSEAETISLQYVGWIPIAILGWSTLGALIAVSIMVRRRFTRASTDNTPMPPVWVDAITCIVGGVGLAVIGTKALAHYLSLSNESPYFSLIAGGIGMLGVPLSLAIFAVGEKLIGSWQAKATPKE